MCDQYYYIKPIIKEVVTIKPEISEPYAIKINVEEFLPSLPVTNYFFKGNRVNYRTIKCSLHDSMCGCQLESKEAHEILVRPFCVVGRNVEVYCHGELFGKFSAIHRAKVKKAKPAEAYQRKLAWYRKFIENINNRAPLKNRREYMLNILISYAIMPLDDPMVDYWNAVCIELNPGPLS